LAKTKRPRPEQVYQEGRRHLEHGRYGQAIKAFKDLGESGRPLLAEAYFRRGAVAGELDDLDQAARLAPDDPRPRLWRALLLLRAGRLEEALQPVRRDPEAYPEPLRQLARAAGGEAGERHAVALAVAALGHGLPTEERAASWRGWVGRLVQAALRVGAGARDEDLPGLPRTVPEPARLLYALYRGAARGALTAEDVAAVADRLTALPEDVRPLARALLRRSLPDLLAGGEVAAAEAVLRLGEEVLSAEERAAVAVRLGAAAWDREDAEAAARHWQAARAVYDLDQPLALAAERQGRYPEAMALWERVLRREARAGGDLRRVYLELSRVAEQAGQLGKAAAYVRRALERGEPEDPWEYERLARLVEDTGGSRKEVVELRRRYLRRVPKDAEVRADLIADLLHLGDVAGAAEAVREVAGEVDAHRELTWWMRVFWEALGRMPRDPSFRQLVAEERDRLETLHRGAAGPWEVHLALWEGEPERARGLLRALRPLDGHDPAVLHVVVAYAWFRLGDEASGNDVVEAAIGRLAGDVASSFWWSVGSCLCASRVLAGRACADGCPDVERYLERSREAVRPQPPATSWRCAAARRCPGFRRLVRTMMDRTLSDLMDELAAEVAAGEEGD
jgi:tetratricopeptide (TPR) repeat protein